MVRPLFGGLLVAAGILIAAASGLCSLAVIGSAFKNPANTGSLPMVVIFGGLPFGVGVLMVFGGMALMRGADGKGSKTY